MVTKKVEPMESPWDDDKAETFQRTAEVPSDREWATITLKAATGYNAPWIVFKPSSIEDAAAIMQHENLDELLDLVARKNKDFERAYGGSQGFSKPSGGSSTGYKAPSAPAGTVEWDEGEGEYCCAHGGATQVKGESAKGPWTGYFCPQPKDATDKCSPKFLNKKR